MHLKNSSFRKILGRGCPTSKSNYDWSLLLNPFLSKILIWLTLLSVVRFSKFEILNRFSTKSNKQLSVFQNIYNSLRLSVAWSRFYSILLTCMIGWAISIDQPYLLVIWCSSKVTRGNMFLLVYILGEGCAVLLAWCLVWLTLYSVTNSISGAADTICSVADIICCVANKITR